MKKLILFFFLVCILIGHVFAADNVFITKIIEPFYSSSSSDACEFSLALKLVVYESGKTALVLIPSDKKTTAKSTSLYPIESISPFYIMEYQYYDKTKDKLFTGSKTFVTESIVENNNMGVYYITSGVWSFLIEALRNSDEVKMIITNTHTYQYGGAFGDSKRTYTHQLKFKGQDGIGEWIDAQIVAAKQKKTESESSKWSF